MTGWVIFLGAAPVVGWIASRHGRSAVAWGLIALVVSGVVSALGVQLSASLLERSESEALAAIVLAPLLGLIAVIAIGVLAARDVEAVVDSAPAVEAEPDEGIAMVHLRDEPNAREAGAPYRAESRCRLVLGAKMLTLEGKPPARTSLAYHLVAATAVDGDVLRLAWTNRDGEDVVVLLRPADADVDQRANVVSTVVQRVAAQNEDQPRA